MSTEISEKPFTIAVPDAALERLRLKLSSTIFPDELDGAQWAYGVPMADLKRLAERWADGYDWRKHETALNAELPQFTRDIEVDGHGALNIHYVHKRSEVQGAIPLLFIHGWPGSFLEARKIVPILTQSSPGHPSFHFVGLGLPGYGFFRGTYEDQVWAGPICRVRQQANACAGVRRVCHARRGFWLCGAFLITRRIATLYGHKHSKAWHTNFPCGDPPHPLRQPIEFLKLIFLTQKDKENLARSMAFFDSGSGYMAQHTTRPQTLAYSLADSPVGLLAWIYEKLVEWTDAYEWDDDEVLTWVSIYWFSRAGPAASTRIYYETAGGSFEGFKRLFGITERPTIPFGTSHFPKELIVFPLSWAKFTGNLVFQQAHERGGHFAAWERPEELVADMRQMFGKGGSAFGVVNGKDGY
ncbi:putative epoxide hydrolase [Mycena indigotica]|uniref:Putative epoxide hydrolase n=1 Tax=Mycena indigotica TaxID=2126181 RepID=A0A8H6WCW6_9AGAR|nr:putative epoxide hydrolase [Mycena indigotica]KAF7310173.1 putative epoxide hydrolase [Mycena indigotica]